MKLSQLRNTSNDDRAVSPVIGVILMVAITVILAAVIATFVLGLGESVSETAPQASFATDFDGSELTMTHNGGASLEASQLTTNINGTAINQTDWAGKYNGTITAGNSLSINASSADRVTLIWENDDGSQTATLVSWKGPDA